MISVMENKEIVGLALRLLRENIGLNAEQMGRRVRRTPAAVYRHESGKKAPALDEVTAYLRVTGCRFAEFEALVGALERFRDRVSRGAGWFESEAADDSLEGAERREHERMAQELGAAAGRFALEFFRAAERGRRL